MTFGPTEVLFLAIRWEWFATGCMNGSHRDGQPDARGTSPRLLRLGSRKLTEMRKQTPSDRQRLREQQSAQYANESEWPFAMPLSLSADANPSLAAPLLDGKSTDTVGSSRANREITLAVVEVHAHPVRQLPDTPIVRCASCGGSRLIPLTYPGVRRTTQSERRARPSTKCVTCGSRYAGTQPLPTEKALISVAERDDANRSAPWGPALAEWALRIDGGENRAWTHAQSAADRTPAIQSLRQTVLQT